MTMQESIAHNPDRRPLSGFTRTNADDLRFIRVVARIVVVIGILLAASAASLPAGAHGQTPYNPQQDGLSTLPCVGAPSAREWGGPAVVPYLRKGVVSAPRIPIPSDTLTQTITVQSSSRLCCRCPEGVFGAIWQADSVIRDRLGSIWAASPHHSLEAFEIDTAYQPFERGAMVWARVAIMGASPLVLALYPDGSFQAFGDTFDAATDPVKGDEAPPSGLYEPMLGFGKVWREQPGVRQALGWATAEETAGKGRHQMFERGHMIWLSQRQETFVFTGDTHYPMAGAYAALVSPTFEVPAPTPPSDAATLILGAWADPGLELGGPTAARELVFSPDGSVLFRECRGRYEVSGGNGLLIDWQGCAQPDPPAGAYQFAFGPAAEVLVLSQQLHEKMPLTGGGEVWTRQGFDEEIWWEGLSIRVPRQCAGEVDYLDDCNIQIRWTDCTMDNIPLAATRYEYAIAGRDLNLSRTFVRAK